MNTPPTYVQFLDMVFFVWGMGITMLVVAMYLDKYQLLDKMKPRFWEPYPPLEYLKEKYGDPDYGNE